MRSLNRRMGTLALITMDSLTKPASKIRHYHYSLVTTSSCHSKNYETTKKGCGHMYWIWGKIKIVFSTKSYLRWINITKRYSKCTNKIIKQKELQFSIWNFSYIKFIVIIHLLMNFNDKAFIHVEAKLLCCHPVQKSFLYTW